MSIKKQLISFETSRQDRMIDLFSRSHARVGLGHTGGHIKMTDWLNFQKGFAQAKDAVFSQFDVEHLKALCDALQLNYLQVDSQATETTPFLLRPDLGKLLAPESHTLLEALNITSAYDLLIVISGGLSPLAVQHHIPFFLPAFAKAITPYHWSIAPIIVTTRSRVAFGDQLNHYFNAKLTVILIGERPGLTTPDSLGVYVTYNAKPGCTDEQRNCISNIHAHGLSYADATARLVALLQIAMQNRLTGVTLQKGDPNLA